MNLQPHSKVFVKQLHEIGEWLGFETRNKYSIQDQNQIVIGYAAEQQKGLLGFLFRQWLGHWRRFDIHFFNTQRELIMIAHHPFRFIFTRVELRDDQHRSLGAIQKRFAFFSKRFHVEDEAGQILLTVSSPIWKFWTFTFQRQDQKAAEVKKRWSGLLSEAFTDKDNFLVDFIDSQLSERDKKLILASAVYIDLEYFEKKA